MDESVERVYFGWLCAKVNTSTRITYDLLFRVLHATEFAWTLLGDDNRSEDGKILREEFILTGDLPDDPDWRLNLPCSFFEMFIAFSYRAEFMTSGETTAREMFWEIMRNLGLEKCNDLSRTPPDHILEILDVLAWRRYERDGTGGMFPIRQPTRDQREVEIWYQFCDYLLDQDRMP